MIIETLQGTFMFNNANYNSSTYQNNQGMGSIPSAYSCPTTVFADPFASVNGANSQSQGDNVRNIQVHNLNDLANIFGSMSIK
ncbi:MAG: hypothetical protein LBI56_03340 [Puniceicoccales bacterium]|jgi:hypothetical protein|nr:hypothetical protein [Puniceicoccales bacterium]